MSSGYRQVDHTADLALELWAPTEPELLVTGARAIVDVLTEGCPLTADSDRTISLDVLDPEDRLVQWLNEIIYAAVTEGFLFCDGELSLGETSLTADVRGRSGAADSIRGELKSATYHELSLTHGDHGWRAFVVIDV